MNEITLNNLLSESNSYYTELFSSVAEKITLKAIGKAPNNVPEYIVFSYDKNGSESIITSEKAIRTSEGFMIEASFDPLYFSVYHNSEKLRIAIKSDNEFELISFILKEEAVVRSNEHTSFSNITVENGEKKAIVRQLDGTSITVPVIPKKVLFMGNSLLLGMTYYGMCATDPSNDYYYHVTTEILKHNPNCEFIKLHGVQIECNESVDAFYDNVYKTPNRVTGRPTVEDLTSDIDLAIIQIGDNVNTPQKVEIFKQICEPFIRILKERCPKARIIWVFGWYNKSNTYSTLVSAFDKWQIESVDISALMPLKENQATKGQLYLKADGSSEVAPDGWLSHPSNVGMYRIAQKILKVIDM